MITHQMVLEIPYRREQIQQKSTEKQTEHAARLNTVFQANLKFMNILSCTLVHTCDVNMATVKKKPSRAPGANLII